MHILWSQVPAKSWLVYISDISYFMLFYGKTEWTKNEANAINILGLSVLVKVQFYFKIVEIY